MAHGARHPRRAPRQPEMRAAESTGPARAERPAAGRASRRSRVRSGPSGPPPDREGVHERLVDAVDLEELLDAAVVDSADRDCCGSERGSRKQDVLADVPGFEQREAIT